MGIHGVASEPLRGRSRWRAGMSNGRARGGGGKAGVSCTPALRLLRDQLLLGELATADNDDILDGTVLAVPLYLLNV